jgi:hypothetical protein
MLAGSATTAFGGVSQAMQSLSRALAARHNVDVEVFSLARDAGDILDFGAIPVHVASVVGPRSFGYAPELLTMLRRRDLDCLHVHGVWMYLSVAARRWHAITGRPYIVSPHGMLDEWAMQSRSLKKRAARLLYEDAHLGSAACLHALCVPEQQSIRRLGFDAPISVVPNGVDRLAEDGPQPAWRTAYGRNARVLLFLGRVTPKKHLAELLEAWRRIAPLAAETGWRLVIVGPPDPGYGGKSQSDNRSRRARNERRTGRPGLWRGARRGLPGGGRLHPPLDQRRPAHGGARGALLRAAGAADAAMQPAGGGSGRRRDRHCAGSRRDHRRAYPALQHAGGGAPGDGRKRPPAGRRAFRLERHGGGFRGHLLAGHHAN